MHHTLHRHVVGSACSSSSSRQHNIAFCLHSTAFFLERLVLLLRFGFLRAYVSVAYSRFRYLSDNAIFAIFKNTIRINRTHIISHYTWNVRKQTMQNMEYQCSSTRRASGTGINVATHHLSSLMREETHRRLIGSFKWNVKENSRCQQQQV